MFVAMMSFAQLSQPDQQMLATVVPALLFASRGTDAAFFADQRELRYINRLLDSRVLPFAVDRLMVEVWAYGAAHVWHDAVARAQLLAYSNNPQEALNLLNDAVVVLRRHVAPAEQQAFARTLYDMCRRVMDTAGEGRHMFDLQRISPREAVFLGHVRRILALETGEELHETGDA